MRITKLLIRITQYLSNGSRAHSNISYLVGHRPAPVASPVGLWPGHLLCTHHFLLPDAKSLMLQHHIYPVCFFSMSWLFFYYSWQNTEEVNIRAQGINLKGGIKKIHKKCQNAAMWTWGQNKNVASSRKKKESCNFMRCLLLKLLEAMKTNTKSINQFSQQSLIHSICLLQYVILAEAKGILFFMKTINDLTYWFLYLCLVVIL